MINDLKELSGLFYLRIALGLMFLVHGFNKLQGLLSGGEQPTGMFVNFFGEAIGPVMAWLVALVEFFGGIFLILGLLTWMSSFLLAGVMAGAIVLVHSGNFAAITQHLVFIAGLVALMKHKTTELSLDEKLKLKF